jgi:hypothetical protein
MRFDMGDLDRFTITTLQLAIAFILGGKALFTAVSGKTDDHITFKVRQYKKNPVLFLVFSRASLPDKKGGFKYLGTIHSNKPDKYFSSTRASQNIPLHFNAFKWMWSIMMIHGRIPNNVKLLHHGVCGRCGKKLTDPKSIELGFGPCCRKLCI